MSPFESTAVSRVQPTDLIPGYRLEKLVGRGGMGEVHQATQLSLGRTVAVKLLSPELARDDSFVARFQKEAAALAALSHPHIVSIVDKGQTQGTYYLVMEYVDGPSLRERMRSTLEVPAALWLMRDICRAIDYAHGRGVIHRDLKPENILLAQQAGGIAKVTDFGLASFLDGEQPHFALTSTHVGMGTLSYMAPEQRLNAKSADGRADIFSLGVILYELLTGEVPLGTFDPPSRRRPGLDPRLDRVVTRCLKPDPADRYPRVAEMLADLEPLVPEQLSTPPRPPTLMQRVGRGLKRLGHAAVRTVEVLLILSALAVLGVTWLRTQGQPEALWSGKDLLSTELMGQLGEPTPQRLRGRLQRATPSEAGSVLLGEGPGPLPVHAFRRPVSLEEGALVFPEVADPRRAGRAEVDVADLRADFASLSANVRARDPESLLVARALKRLYGLPEPVAALVLVGRPGRYVALLHRGDGAPLVVEWALGERRGSMLSAIPSPEGEASLELSIDADGVVQAFVGTGRDKRRIAEPLVLGPRWQEQFLEPPRPAFGCVGGSCRASGFSYVVRPAPPPSAVAVAAPAPEAPSTPAPLPAEAPPPAVKPSQQEATPLAVKPSQKEAPPPVVKPSQAVVAPSSVKPAQAVKPSPSPAKPAQVVKSAPPPVKSAQVVKSVPPPVKSAQVVKSAPTPARSAQPVKPPPTSAKPTQAVKPSPKPVKPAPAVKPPPAPVKPATHKTPR